MSLEEFKLKLFLLGLDFEEESDECLPNWEYQGDLIALLRANQTVNTWEGTRQLHHKSFDEAYNYIMEHL